MPSRYLVFALLGLTLTACEKTLESDRLAQSIQQDVIAQGGLSLKSVTCPTGIKLEAGATFECVGEMDNGYTFTVPVKQQDATGKVLWDVPHAKGLVNLVKFETLVQEVVQGEIGARPIVRCGSGYKAVKPGQKFECPLERPAKPPTQTQIAKAKPSDPATNLADGVSKARPEKPSKPDKVVVEIDAESNITWERVLANAAKAAAGQAQPSQTAATVSAASAETAPAAIMAQPAASPVPAQQNAQDFLNQPGASDQFQD